MGTSIPNTQAPTPSHSGLSKCSEPQKITDDARTSPRPGVPFRPSEGPLLRVRRLTPDKTDSSVSCSREGPLICRFAERSIQPEPAEARESWFHQYLALPSADALGLRTVFEIRRSNRKSRYQAHRIFRYCSRRLGSLILSPFRRRRPLSALGPARHQYVATWRAACFPQHAAPSAPDLANRRGRRTVLRLSQPHKAGPITECPVPATGTATISPVRRQSFATHGANSAVSHRHAIDTSMQKKADRNKDDQRQRDGRHPRRGSFCKSDLRRSPRRQPPHGLARRGAVRGGMAPNLSPAHRAQVQFLIWQPIT